MDRPAVLIFDIGNVIVAHDNDLLWDRLAALCPDPEAARSKILPLVRESAIGTGRESVRSLHRRLTRELRMSANPDAFAEAWNSHFTPIPGMPELLTRLAVRLPLVLLSNTNAAHWDHIRVGYPVVGLFPIQLLSHEVGLLKPVPAIFELAAARAGQPAGRCFFTDDLQSNVDGALRCGMDAVRFEGCEALRKALAVRGIEA